MKKSLSILFLFLFSVAYTQKATDSLRAELEKATARQEKFDILLSLTHYYGFQNTDSAIYFGEKALEAGKLSEDPKDEAKALARLGLSYSYRNEFARAVEYLTQAQAILDQHYDTLWMALIFNEYGIIHLLQHQLEDALPPFKKSLQLKNALNDSIGIAKTLNNIAGVYEQLDKFDSSIYFHKRSLAIKERLQEGRGIAHSKVNLSSIYFNLQKYDTAMVFAREAVSGFRSANDIEGEIYALNMVSEVFRMTDKIDSAIFYQKEALSAAERLKVLRRLQDGSKKLSWLYEDKGDFETALEYLNDYITFKDSVDNERNVRKIEQLKAGYEIEKREIEIDKQEAVIAKQLFQRNSSIIGAILLAIIGGLVINRQKLTIRTKKREKELAELQLEKANEELSLREQELLTYVITVSQKNNLLHNIKDFAKPDKDLDSCNKKLKKIHTEIINGRDLTQQWEEFRMRFEKIHQGFFKKLSEVSPNLTNNDRRICAYLKMGLSSKQISNLQNITVASVEVQRSRIRKKLGLSTEENLSSFIMNL
mgnify:CR=1 FL=1